MTYQAAHPFTRSELLLAADGSVTLEELIHFAGIGRTVAVTPEVRERVQQSRRTLEQAVAEGQVIYGVNTSVGGFVDHLVPLAQAAELQGNLIRAVASNVGDYFDENVTRAAMLARIVSLARGNSGISLENFERFLAIYNAGVVPCVPAKGSLGTSGDLGPLGAIAAVLIGEWKARFEGDEMSGAEALAKAGVRPLELSYKEGLALVNGTSAMVALAALNVVKARSLLDIYVQVSGLTFEGLGAKSKPFDPRVHALKPHDGQMRIARALWNQLAGSGLIVDEVALSAMLSTRFDTVVHQEEQPIEDCYSIRCTPQILGPVLETIEFAERTVTNELNSSNDNPLITCHDGEIFHNGHFHGQYIAAAMDYLTIATITLCNLSDRRIDKLLTPANNHGLPGFLCKENPGLRLGLMGGQFMSTSLTAENRSLATPLSIQTLTSTGDFQDVVSFGLVAARRSQEVLANTRYVAAFELICACQAVDIRGSDKLGPAGRTLYARVRQIVPYLDRDVILTDYVEQVVTTIFGTDGQ